MPRSNTAGIDALATEVVRRHSCYQAIPSRWDLVARWRRRRYERQLADAPLLQLRQAIATAENGRSPSTLGG